MPNALAFAALTLWPVVSVALFRWLPVGRALLASLILAYLFLPPPPAEFNLPLLPALNKETLPSIVAFLMCVVMYRPRMEIVPRSPVIRALLVLYILSPLLTVVTNDQPVFFGQFGLPALQLREAVGVIALQAILILPFLMARNFLRDDAGLRDVMLALVIGGLVYSLPMLLEVRLSPMLNVWIYGFFQHDFGQTIRFGGYRPIVFLYHGLWVAFFAMSAVVAALAFMKAETGGRAVFFGAAALYLIVVLILCKSVGSLMYAALLVPAVVLLGGRMQLRLAVLLAALAVTYPLAKGLDIVPEARLLQIAGNIQDERAESLQYRFDNEARLVERAAEKPLFGWGMWGRNHVFNTQTGRMLTVTDGRWIILIGTFGWLGFLAEFGLLAAPIFLIWLRHHGQTAPVAPFVGPACLILAINLVDLIPNATITPLTWGLAGAILGYAEAHVPRMLRVAPAFRTVI